MNTQHLGSLLKTLRIERQMTQEYVSEGICSRRHLINIESGKVLPNSFILVSVLQKMNCHNFFEILKFSSCLEPLFVYNAYDTIKDLKYNQTYDALSNFLNSISNHPDFNKGDHKHFLNWHRAICINRLQHDTHRALHLLKTSLSFDIFDFVEDKKSINLRQLDIEILNSYGTILADCENYDLSIKILKRLDNYLESLEVFSNKKEFHIKLLYNLSKVLTVSKKYEESLLIVNKGIRQSKAIKSYAFLGYLYYQKADNLLHLDQTANIKKNLLLAYTLFDIGGNDSIKDIIREKAQNKYHISIDSIGIL